MRAALAAGRSRVPRERLWPSRESAAIFAMSANVATPYLATPLPRCAFVLDRHTHKNGGSTMRSIFADNDRLDGWVYWGYSLNQQAPFAQRLVAALQPPRGNGSCFACGR